MSKEEKIKWLRVKDIRKYIEFKTGILLHRTTIYNWIHKGRLGYDAEPVKLQVKKKCGLLFSTEEWVDEFLREFQDEN